MEVHNSSSGGGASNQKVQCAGSPEPSCVSLKSDQSMDEPLLLSSEPVLHNLELQTEKTTFPESSCLSMKSNQSIGIPPGFSSGPMPSNPKWHSTEAAMQTHVLEKGSGDSQQGCFHTDDDVFRRALERHKISMENKYESLFEGFKTEANKTLLNRVYTQLYIIEGESKGVNEEHEVLQMEKTHRKHINNTLINCSDIFKTLQGPEKETVENCFTDVTDQHDRHEQMKENNGSKLRTVLTKGIAGIGKTVSVQKFILDWSKREANQDVDFMFVLPFRELNLIKDYQHSLHGLLCDFHPELKDLDPKIYDICKVVIIFDGLDESIIPLNFLQCEKVSDVTTVSSVGVLMTNLIKGDLLPSALIWITSRPTAANQIPCQYINRMTEIQGFSDPQKEEYIRKRITDQVQADNIISRIRTARTLHIMCHIPVFCWISATVLQHVMKQHKNLEPPKTLTEMYMYFLLTQTNKKNEKYERKNERDPKKLLESNRTILLKLAELAFKQLMKGSVVFDDYELKEFGIDVTEASVYSGIFTEIVKEEPLLYQRKVYCFVHLSFQEFLAAFYVFHCYECKNMEPLQFFLHDDDDDDHCMYYKISFTRDQSENVPLDDLLKGAVVKALKSRAGHLDLFLRFLLGLSLDTNQRLLQGLLTQTESSSEKITEFIKEIIKGEDDHISTDRHINLFLCLCEMNDQSLSSEIQEYLDSGKHSETRFSPGQCSTLAYILLRSEEVMDEFNLKKYNTSKEGYRRLIPAVSVCKKALLAGCNITTESCETLCSVLQSANSQLKELDLSNNNIQDSGVELLFVGLKSSHCKLQILRLAGCNLTTKSCKIISFTLQSANSPLKDMDLSNNHLQDSGVELLSAGLKSPHCKLVTLRLAVCNLGEKACENLGLALQSNSLLKELDLSNNDLQDSGVDLLSAGLKSSCCKLEILKLSGCMITDEGCYSLALALKLNPFYLRELDLTYNHPGKSGLKLLSDLLEDSHCTLEMFRVKHGGENRMKPGLSKYACQLTLAPNTAHTNLALSEENRKVTYVWEPQPAPDHPERFDVCMQVLCRESLTGRCYWEAEWSGEAFIAVTYKGISRKGNDEDCVFGFNEKSWRLYCYENTHSGDSNNEYSDDLHKRHSVIHNKRTTDFPATPSNSNRVGVYLDWVAGTLSFYSISDSHIRTHLHTLHAMFTEPLYTGFMVWYHSCSVRLCEIE